MEKTNSEQAMCELTMMLIYLSRFADGEKFEDAKDFYSWKGYNFNVLNKLENDDYIRQGDRPSRSKKMYITGSGIEQAKELLNKYGINDWDR